MKEDVFSQEFLEIVRRFYLLLLSLPILMAIVGYGVAVILAPQYSSTAFLRLSPAMARDYAALWRSPEVAKAILMEFLKQRARPKTACDS